MLKEPTSVESVKKLQKVHDVELCPHVKEYFNGELMDLTTCWAWITEIGTDEVHLCEGSPCQNDYSKLKLSKK